MSKLVTDKNLPSAMPLESLFGISFQGHLLSLARKCISQHGLKCKTGIAMPTAQHCRFILWQHVISVWHQASKETMHNMRSCSVANRLTKLMLMPVSCTKSYAKKQYGMG